MATVCNGCGTRKEEWERNPDAYVGDFHTCEGCARLEEERDNVPEGTKGVHYRLVDPDTAQERAEAMGDMTGRRTAEDDDNEDRDA